MRTDEVLDRTADLLERRGRCRNDFEDDRGRVCLRGALLRVAWRGEDEVVFDYLSTRYWARAAEPENLLYEAAATAVGRRVGVSTIAWWSDRVADDAVVLGALRGAAIAERAGT